jgi:hypothetical protein
MAQDFYAAFQLGEDERYISSVDADGVALASIQALAVQVQQQADQIERLEGQLEQAQVLTYRFESLLAALMLGVAVGGWIQSMVRRRSQT